MSRRNFAGSRDGAGLFITPSGQRSCDCATNVATIINLSEFLLEVYRQIEFM